MHNTAASARLPALSDRFHRPRIFGTGQPSSLGAAVIDAKHLIT